MQKRSQHNDKSPDDIFISSLLPALVDFTRWVMNSAIEDGRKRLYFLARDAYMPYLIATKIAKEEKINLDIRYLEVSRYSLRRAEFALGSTDIASRVAIGGIDVSMAKIMDRAGISETLGKEILKDSPINKDYYEVLSKVEIARLREFLSDSTTFVNIVREESQKSYETTMGYLKQEGLFDDIPYSIVDSGWVGSIQETLKQLLWTVKPVHFTGYYFGLYEIPRGVSSSDYNSFYFKPYRDIKKKVLFSNCLFETVFSSSKGMTKGYELIDKRFVPVYETKNSLNKEAIEGFVSCSLAADVTKSDLVEVRKHLKAMSRLMYKPTIAEASSIGRLRFCDDVIENTVLDIAATLSNKDILRIYRVRSGWTEASIVNTKRLTALRLAYLRLYKYSIYIRKFIRNKLG